jgi:hypothetical protein
LLQHPGVSEGQRIEGVHITDMGATIMALCGLQRPADFDGRALAAAPQASKSDATAPSAATSGEQVYAPAEERELAARLRDLGYLQ